MLSRVDCVHCMGRLPFELEGRLTGEGTPDETGLASETQSDVVGDEHRRPALGHGREAALVFVHAARDRQSLAYSRMQFSQRRGPLLRHGVFATSLPAKNERIHSIKRLARFRTPRSCMR